MTRRRFASISLRFAASSPASLRRASSRSSARVSSAAAADLADVELQRILACTALSSASTSALVGSVLGLLLGSASSGASSDRLRSSRSGTSSRWARSSRTGRLRGAAAARSPPSIGWYRLIAQRDLPVPAESIANLGSRFSSNLTRVSLRGALQIAMCGIAGYSLSSRSAVDRTLAAQSLLAGDRRARRRRRRLRPPAPGGAYPVVTKQRTPREPAPRADRRPADGHRAPRPRPRLHEGPPVDLGQQPPGPPRAGRRDPQRDHPERRRAARAATAVARASRA